MSKVNDNDDFQAQFDRFFSLNFWEFSRLKLFRRGVNNPSIIVEAELSIILKIKTETTAQKMKFSIKDFFSTCDHWWHLLKIFLMENFIFNTVSVLLIVYDVKVLPTMFANELISSFPSVSVPVSCYSYYWMFLSRNSKKWTVTKLELY